MVRDDVGPADRRDDNTLYRHFATLAVTAAAVGWLGFFAHAAAPIPEPRPASIAAESEAGAGDPPPVPVVRPPRRNALISNADHRRLAALIRDVGAGAWSRIEQDLDGAEEPLLADYARWLYFRYGPGARDRDELAAFIVSHPQWPEQHRLEIAIEQTMDDNTPNRVILDWFAARTPRTSDGRLALARAMLETGDTQRGAALLRKTWIEDTHDGGEQRSVLRNFGKLLHTNDHIARLDNLLWNGHRTSATRMLGRVPPDIRKLAEARIALMQFAGNVDTLIARVPAKLQDDPGLLYERARWRRVKGKDDGATEILLDLPKNLGPRPDKWWVEQQLQVRNALNDGKVKLAYKLAADSRQPAGSVAHADAEFLAGWIALRFLHKPDTAYAHFGRLYHAVQYPISLARAAYWSARAADEIRRFDLAEQWLRVAADHPTTFYGQLGLERLRARALRFAPPPRPTVAEKAAFDAHPVVRITRILAEAGETDRLRPLIRDLHERATSPVSRWMVGQLAIEVGRFDLAVRAGKQATRAGDMFVDVAFPRLPMDSQLLESALIHAVSRQESEFNVTAHSPAGARGLMQLMPATARAVARQSGVAYREAALTTDPAYNARLGATYLRGLIEDYAGSYVLAVAAYNAGPSRVNRWIKDFGDPRADDVDVIDWIELIPFSETRNYVQRVMENLQVYRHLMAQRPERSIVADLNSHLRPGQAVGCDKC
jgi:soluble lytic murein transglycosylase